MSRKTLIKGGEAEVLKSVLQWLERQPNIWAWREPNGPVLRGPGGKYKTPTPTPGKPDVCGMIYSFKDKRTYPLMIECKEPGWKPLQLPEDPKEDNEKQDHWRKQLEWLERCAAFGGIALIATSFLDCSNVLSDHCQPPSKK